MLEPVIYIRGTVSSPRDTGLPESAVNDAKILLNLTVEQAESIGGEIASFTGFLDRKTLQMILTKHLNDDSLADRLAFFVIFVSKFVIESRQQVGVIAAKLNEWVEQDKETRRHSLSQQNIADIEKRLPFLCQPFASVERQAKAERLITTTGQRLEEVDIICDVRPVFDESRNTIEGMIPYTILKVVCTGVDGLPVSLEAILSDRQVDELFEASGKAQTKLRTIRNTLCSYGVPVPQTEITSKE